MLARIVCIQEINGLRKFVVLLVGVICEMQLLFAVCKLHALPATNHQPHHPK